MRLLRVTTVAKRLNCSVSNVYRLIEGGHLICVNRGPKKGYAIQEEELERFLVAAGFREPKES